MTNTTTARQKVGTLLFCLLSINSFGQTPYGETIAEEANKVIGTKYVWGGNSMTKGLDCSALVKNIYAKFGYKIPRTAKTQARNTKSCPTYTDIKNVKIGDALYFDNGKKIHHTAIVSGFTAGGEAIITHAKGENYGVIREQISKRYKKELVAIKRFYECSSPLSGEYSNVELASIIRDASMAFGVNEELLYELIVATSDMNPKLITTKITRPNQLDILDRLKNEGVLISENKKKENVYYIVPRKAKEGEIIIEALKPEGFNLRVGLMQVDVERMSIKKAKSMIYPFPNLIQAKEEFIKCKKENKLKECFEF